MNDHKRSFSMAFHPFALSVSETNSYTWTGFWATFFDVGEFFLKKDDFLFRYLYLVGGVYFGL
ncbi:MAG: hypothetical protein ACI8V2_003349 [Candidatus Latescibacterota bacterium]|jgi:hypothetical protein